MKITVFYWLVNYLFLCYNPFTIYLSPLARPSLGFFALIWLFS